MTTFIVRRQYHQYYTADAEIEAKDEDEAIELAAKLILEDFKFVSQEDGFHRSTVFEDILEVVD